MLRAYEILLNRLPEAAALSGNTTALDNSSQSLQQLYGTIQASPEFAADVASTGGSNPYGITASTSYGSIHTIAVSNQVTSLITPLVTSNGVAVHS